MLLDAAPDNPSLFIEFRRWRIFLPLFPSMPAGYRPDNFISIKGRGAYDAQFRQIEWVEALRKKSRRKAEEGHPAPDRGRGSLLWRHHNNTGYHATCTLVQGVLQYDGLGTCRLAKWHPQYEERSAAIRRILLMT